MHYYSSGVCNDIFHIVCNLQNFVCITFVCIVSTCEDGYWNNIFTVCVLVSLILVTVLCISRSCACAFFMHIQLRMEDQYLLPNRKSTCSGLRTATIDHRMRQIILCTMGESGILREYYKFILYKDIPRCAQFT